MPCYSPLQAWKLTNGEVVFVERGDVYAALSLPCGQCIGCRLERSRKWAMRCMHEASLRKANSFVTLTYDDDHVPKDGSLNVRDWQLFAKRFRKRIGEFRFYMCGEYGEHTWRPHYHALLFGRDFCDKVYFGKSPGGSRLYISDTLSEVWGNGHSSIGDVTFESAAYCARYCVTKRTGHNAKDWYHRRNCHGVVVDLKPEFNIMSRRPGIGADFFDTYKEDIYPHDYVVVNGNNHSKPPRFYDERYARYYPDEMEDIKFRREQVGRSRWQDNTPERLKVREEVEIARSKRLKRSI